jgi:hypothetical protein
MQFDNPSLSALVRFYSIIVIIVFAFAVSPLWAPDVILPRWPWPLTPFTARFIGAVYTALAGPMIVLALVNRWSPGRIVFIASLTFTAILTIVSFLHLGRFDFSKTGTWIWFAVYPLTDLALVYLIWRYATLPAPGRALAPVWRGFFGTQAMVFGIYGLALVVAPGAATSFWPWPIDPFHAQLYSAVFITNAVAAYLLARSAHGLDLLVIGIFQAVFGVAAIAGLFIADASLGRVVWSAPGTILWLAGCVAFVGLGLASLAAARSTVRAVTKQ